MSPALQTVLGTVALAIFAFAWWSFRRMLDNVARIPSAEWFAEVRAKLEQIPDESLVQRLISHLDNAAQHEVRLGRVEGTLGGIEARLESGSKKLTDHDTRLSDLDVRVKLLERK